jgi:polysaccharide export outer membrane protein
MRLCCLFALSLVAVLSGCAHEPQRYSAAPQAAADLDAMAYGGPQVTAYAARSPPRAVAPFDREPYTLDAGDRLRIVVFGQDNLSNTYVVGAAGAVSMPLIGSVPARGLTPTQLANAVAARLRQSFIRDPSVAVEIETYRPFFVLGEVTYPGQYPYVPNMTAEAAIAIAGGFTPRAVRGPVEVARTINGAPARLTLPLQERLRPGDAVTVAERWF